MKDWVDILLLARQGPLQAQTLRHALEATFQARATHPLPQAFPGLSKTWVKPFLRLAEQINVSLTLEQVNDALARFLDPILQQRAAGSWRPDLWEWK